MDNNVTSEVYYFWTDEESNTHGVTVADSESDNFSVVEEFTFDEISGLGIGFDDLTINQIDADTLISVDGSDLALIVDTAPDLINSADNFAFG